MFYCVTDIKTDLHKTGRGQSFVGCLRPVLFA